MTDSEDPRDPFDPKPEPMPRRQFVKTAMGAAAFGAVAATGAGLAVPLSTSGRLNIRRFPYIGARRIAGPAPQGIPLIPVRVNDEGFVEGVPELKESPVEHSLEWYKYCAHEAAPGLEPGFTDDNVLRYFNNPAKLTKAASDLGAPLWYANKLDQKMMAADFTEVGQGAPFRWRSEEQEGTNIITGIIVKVDPERMKGSDGSAFMAPEHNLLAFCSFCAHFCCVPGYKESKIPRESFYRGRNLFDTMYCTCHDSVYDPQQLKDYTFPPNM